MATSAMIGQAYGPMWLESSAQVVHHWKQYQSHKLSFLANFMGKGCKSWVWKIQLLSCNDNGTAMDDDDDDDDDDGGGGGGGGPCKWCSLSLSAESTHVKYILTLFCQSCVKCLHKYAVLRDDTWAHMMSMLYMCVCVCGRLPFCLDPGIWIWQDLRHNHLLPGTCLWDSSLAWRRLQSIWADID